MCMKSCAFVTTPNAWCVPRSLSLLTTNSDESTQIVGSSRIDPSFSVTNAGSMLPVAIACRERIGNHLGERAIVADRAREDVGNPLTHARVHDPVPDHALLYCAGDGTRRSHLIDRAHVEAVTTGRRLAGSRHSKRGSEYRSLDVVHRHGVSREERRHETVLDEPDHVRPRARMNQRRPGHPDRVTTAIALFDENVRHQCVVDRLLARHLTRHELELALLVAEEGAGVNVDAFQSVFGAADGDHVAFLQLAPFPDPELVVVEYERRVHPGLARHAPRTFDANVGRKIRRRKKAFR